MTDTARSLQETVEALCSEETAGRAPGTPQGIAARQLVTTWFEEAGLEPAGSEGFHQLIPGIEGANIIGSVGGSGMSSDRFVIIGAHYDHVGIDGDDIFWGADDNASGVAVLLEVAARLTQEAPELNRTVIVCSFDAEEPPNFLGPTMGSQWLVDHPLVPNEAIDTMVCLDIVGHALGPPELPGEVRDSIFVLGAEKGAGNGALVGALPARPGIIPRRVGTHIVPAMSDYHAYEQAEVPYLFYTCGRTTEYHTPGDTPDLLDYAKMAALVDHLVDLVVALANRPEDRVDYLPRGEDDAATIASLRAVLEPLSGTFPAADQALGLLTAATEEVAASGELNPGGRQLLASILLGIEEAVG